MTGERENHFSRLHLGNGGTDNAGGFPRQEQVISRKSDRNRPIYFEDDKSRSMALNTLDLAAILLFFLSMLVVGVWSYFKSSNSEDYSVAGS